MEMNPVQIDAGENIGLGIFKNRVECLFEPAWVSVEQGDFFGNAVRDGNGQNRPDVEQGLFHWQVVDLGSGEFHERFGFLQLRVNLGAQKYELLAENVRVNETVVNVVLDLGHFQAQIFERRA